MGRRRTQYDPLGDGETIVQQLDLSLTIVVERGSRRLVLRMSRFADHISPPQTCESLAELVLRSGAQWLREPKFSATPMELPSARWPQLAICFDPQARLGTTSEAIALLPGGRVYGSGIIIAPDGKTVARDVSLDFGYAGGGHWLLNNQKMRIPERIPGQVAVVATALGESYAHWLLDELPRLISLRREGDFPNLIAHADSEYSRTALKLANFSARLIAPARRQHLQADQLVVPALPGWIGRVSAEHIRRITDFAAPGVKSSSLSPERIYISRAVAQRRRVENESEIHTALNALGFVAIQLENLSWFDQMSLFRGAKIVVAPHGAGLANLVFSRPGTRVIECFGREYVNACFSQLAAICGLDYVPLVANGEGPWGTDPKANRRDFTVSLPELLDALD